MAVLTVFSNNLSPATGSLTARFTRARGFYISAPLIASEIEIDVFLQVYFPTATGERTRKIDLGKLKDGEIKLNEVDTESLVSIPSEFVDSGLEMALLFLGSSTTFLEVYVVGAECTLCSIDAKIEQILAVIEDAQSSEFLDAVIEFAIDNILPQLLQNILPGVSNILLQIATQVLLPAILNALPGGTTPSLPPAANNIALGGSTVGFGTTESNTNTFSPNFT